MNESRFEASVQHGAMLERAMLRDAEMKTIGLLGGMSWESTVSYYQTINRTIAERLGGLHSAKIILYSIDFAEIEYFQQTSQWEQAGELLAACQRGARCIILGCTEIAMLLQATASAVPLFDTAVIHARAAALHALGEAGPI